MRKTINNIVTLLLFVFVSGCTYHSSLLSDLNNKKNQGITYQKEQLYGATVHIVTIDPRYYKIRIIKADSLEYPSVLAKKNKALIAMNAGFFHADGRPSGPLKINKTWISYPSNKNRGALGWKNTTNPEIFYFDRLNFMNMKRDMWQKLDNVIGGIPLLLKRGKVINPTPEAAIPTFIEEKHARSAFCVNRHKQIVFVYVEGLWTPILKSGMTIPELTQLLKNLDCSDGINFDGGRSSTLIINDKNVKTNLLFTKERKVSNILAIFPNQ